MEGGFEWGWDALVAIGTLALAAVTVVLAWGTRRMAGAATRDVRSQWRPAIAPGNDVEVDYAEGGVAILSIQNVGRGAAYRLDAGLDLGESVVPASPWTPGEPEPRNFAVLPPEASAELYFEFLDSRPSNSTLVIDYEDLNGRPYASRIFIDDYKSWSQPEVPVLRMTRVELLDDRELIPWKPPRGRFRYMAFRLGEWWRWRRIKPTADTPEF